MGLGWATVCECPPACLRDLRVVQPVGQTPVYRYGAGRLVRVNEALISLIWCLLVGGIATGASASHLPAADQSLTYAFGVTTVVCAVLTVRRSFRIELEITQEEIRIRNYWRDFEFPWSQVTDVGMGVAIQGIAYQPAITFQLLDGTKRRAKATPYGADRQREAVRAIVALAPQDAPFRIVWAQHPAPPGTWRPDASE